MSEKRYDYQCSECREMHEGLCAVNVCGTPYCSKKCYYDSMGFSRWQQFLRRWFSPWWAL